VQLLMGSAFVSAPASVIICHHLPKFFEGAVLQLVGGCTLVNKQANQ
jgi:hypothetical protein